MNRDIGTLSNVGIIYADREYLDSFNRAGGLDYRARLKNRWTLTGQAVTSARKMSATPPRANRSAKCLRLTCSGQSYSQQVSIPACTATGGSSMTTPPPVLSPTPDSFAGPMCASPTVRTGILFVPPTGSFFRTGPVFTANASGTTPGHPLDFYINPSYSVSFKYRTSVSAYITLGQDRLRPVDYPALTQDVEYHSHTSGFNFYTSPGAYLSIGGGVSRRNGYQLFSARQ